MSAYLENISKKSTSKTTAPKITTPDNTAFGISAPIPKITTPKITTPDNTAFGLTHTAESLRAKAAADKAAADRAAAKKEEVFGATIEQTSEISTATNAVPQTPPPVATPVAPKTTVKTAPIDTVLFNDDSIPIEVINDLIFENIGGHELINIARNDIINGQQVSYQPIKNLSSIQQQYNPNNILGIQNTSDKYFANFSIKFENKVPEIGNGPNGSNVYLDSTTGNLVIETTNMDNDEQVEIEITVSGILYEADFGEII
jgi:hypothetical protein